MTYSYKEAKALVRLEMLEQFEKTADAAAEVLSIPAIMGPVGSGKTNIMKELAKEFKMELLSINCGESGDSTDIAGILDPWAMKPERANRYMEWVLDERMHRACNEPVILFFDDIDKMPELVEGALIGLFGKREVRRHNLHPETIMVAAGNRVADDRLARQLSESLRTRITVIQMEPTVKEFSEFGKESGQVAPTVIGYLGYKGEHLHQKREDVMRFPTPRGWVEASARLKKYDATEKLPGTDTALWKIIVDLKCGDHVGNDFWAWYTIVSKVDVQKLLTTGALSHDLGNDEIMAHYAAVFAVTQELNTKGVKPSYRGLETFVESLQPEMRVAMLTQLTKQSRNSISTHFKNIGDLLLGHLVKSGV